ncbi:MAG: TetR/AcrR family transcriptional regulator [Pseudomonadota bacterium]
MPRSTKANAVRNRQRLFEEARRQFAARGFHATSIGNIAAAVGLTKQSLLHHFGSKENLFSEVLEDLAANMADRVLAIESQDLDPADRLEAFLLDTLLGDTNEQMQIVIRELLENSERASGARQWHLIDYLSSLVSMVQAVPGNRDLTDSEAFARLYFLLGAVSYFKISQPTLQGMLGNEQKDKVQLAFAAELHQFIHNNVIHT